VGEAQRHNLTAHAGHEPIKSFDGLGRLHYTTL
jgi:hypothetical protein